MDRAYPANPVVCRVWRGNRVESVHRGAWCLVDTAGEVLEARGDVQAPYFVRSAIKSIQALPLLETGAAERFSLGDDELVLALASHSGEPDHTERVAGLLARLGLGVEHLRCGVHPPNDPSTRRDLAARGERPSALHNNCSGKHAGFLALARHLDVPLERYLEPDSAGQRLVQEALGAMTDCDPAGLVLATDGCSAPTFALPLRALALAFARVANPEGLPAPRRAHLLRMTDSARRYPVLVAGTHRRIDTDLLRATDGRLFAKIGAEAIHAVGLVEGDRALALKIDDGALRAQHALLVALLDRFGLLGAAAEAPALAAWRDPVLRNHAGLAVGWLEAVLD